MEIDEALRHIDQLMQDIPRLYALLQPADGETLVGAVERLKRKGQELEREIEEQEDELDELRQHSGRTM